MSKDITSQFPNVEAATANCGDNGKTVGNLEASESSVVDDGQIQLGFIESCQPWKLVSRFFPSKVGGRPAWLEPEHLPAPESLLCQHCRLPLVFLCQLYAPTEHCARAYHRTVFLFVCRTPACSQQPAGGVLALRSQLPLQNPYYPDTPLPEVPVLEKEDPHCAAHYNKLCAVCGCRGPANCAGCKQVHYCHRHHQTIDWKHGHKKLCKGGGGAGSGASRFLLPEAELVMEDEPAEVKEAEKSEQQRMADFNSLKLKEKIESMPDADLGELDQLAASDAGEDAAFARFRRRVAREPEQVVRYGRGGAPLWVAAAQQPTVADLPHCANCGARRQFEFQILPQMLNHLDLDETGDSVDWGTLAVFTCREDCTPPADAPSAYLTEVVWKQQM